MGAECWGDTDCSCCYADTGGGLAVGGGTGAVSGQASSLSVSGGCASSVYPAWVEMDITRLRLSVVETTFGRDPQHDFGAVHSYLSHPFHS